MCPLISKQPHPRCLAVVGDVPPTLHERECFCATNEFTHCPTLRLMLRLGRRLEEEEYFELLLPPLR